MKILFWSELFWPFIGGIEIFGEKLMRALQRRGFEFTVITSELKGAPDEEDWDGIRIIRLPLRSGLTGNLDAFKFSLRKLSEIREQFQPDLHHLNNTGPNFIYYLKTKGNRPSRSLFTLHIFIPDHFSNTGSFGDLLQGCDKINAVSRFTLEQAKKIFPFLKNNSSVIYNGLPEPPIAPTPLNFEDPTIGILSRLSPEKGIDVALRAFGKLILKYPKLRFQIGGEGPERKPLEKLSQELGLANHVHFVGKIIPEEVYPFIDRMTFMLLPSRGEEGFPLCALQSGLMGRPLIASDSGGLKEAVKDGVTGILVTKENPQELEEAMTFLINNPDQALEIGKNAETWIRSQFSHDKMVDSYEELYRNLRNSQQAEEMGPFKSNSGLTPV